MTPDDTLYLRWVRLDILRQITTKDSISRDFFSELWGEYPFKSLSISFSCPSSSPSLLPLLLLLLLLLLLSPLLLYSSVSSLLILLSPHIQADTKPLTRAVINYPTHTHTHTHTHTQHEHTPLLISLCLSCCHTHTHTHRVGLAPFSVFSVIPLFLVSYNLDRPYVCSSHTHLGPCITHHLRSAASS